METHVLALLALCTGLICPGNFSPLQSSLSDVDLSQYLGNSDEYEVVDVNKNADGSNQYNFRAFERDLSMILDPVDGFVSSAKQQCHYEGKLVDGSEANIAISTCQGLSGYISVGGEDYFIAKLSKEHAMKFMGVEDPHIIFKATPAGASCTQESDRTQSSRKRCSIDDDSTRPKKKYVEIKIYVDEHLYAILGDDAMNDTLTIFNQVRQLYADKSLGNDIKLVIKQITVFQESQNGLESTEDTDIYLNHFCKWQQNETEGAPDVSVLVTGLNLQSVENYAIIGKASDIGGACNPNKRCVIAEYSSGTGVFTIAHEIAHTLGIYHDGGLGDCKNKNNIMAASSPKGSNAWKWSSCSRNDLANFLADPTSSCLDNKPTDKPMYNPDEWVLPGSVHDATEQCQTVFPGTNAGVSASVKNTEALCTELMCDNSENQDLSISAPALAGTKCGNHGFCLKGRCLHDRNTMQCSGQMCPGMWTTSLWGTCSNCERSRVVACTEVTDDGTVTLLTDSSCPSDGVPTKFEYCNCDLTECFTPCGTVSMTYMYLVGDFGICSSACGVSTQSRSVVCIDEKRKKY